MSEQENVAVVRRAYGNFKGGDIGGILDSLTDDVDWRLPEMAHVPQPVPHESPPLPVLNERRRMSARRPA